MDQTILDSSDPYLFERPAGPEALVILKRKIKESLNWNVVNIIKRAAKLRPDKVSAICLLTNNSSHILVSAVDEVLYEETSSKGKFKTYRENADDKGMPPRDKPYFFDSIMMRNHSSRTKTIDNNPPKSIIDIINMMYLLGLRGLEFENLMKDTYFFDDIGTHNLRQEFNFMSDGKYKDHYIQITPPYNKLLQDKTDYRPILHALAALDKEQPELPLVTPLRRGPSITYYRIPRTSAPLPSAGPPPPTPYRNRSNTRVNENNLQLPPPPQEQSVHKKPTIGRTSLMGAFSRGGTKSRKTRKGGGCRKNLRLSTRKQKFRHSFRQNIISSFC